MLAEDLITVLLLVVGLSTELEVVLSKKESTVALQDHLVDVEAAVLGMEEALVLAAVAMGNNH